LYEGRPQSKIASTGALLAVFGWDIFFHPSYSPDPTPSYFHLFTHLKQFLDGNHMGSDEEVKKTVKDWFNGVAADFYNTGTQKLVTQYDMSLNLYGDYVEK
jgi:hypothetical protein